MGKHDPFAGTGLPGTGPGNVVETNDMVGLMHSVRQQGSDEMGFRISREPRPGETFSAEGIESLVNGFRAFVVGRIAAAWEDAVADGDVDTVIGPHDVTLTASISIDSKPPKTVAVDLWPWWAVDGTPRREAERKVRS